MKLSMSAAEYVADKTGEWLDTTKVSNRLAQPYHSEWMLSE
jgi:hypothetical protein